jgi:hypothetical protein
MANSVHNAVLKMLQDRGMLGFVGLAYQQTSQMVFSPTGSATEMSPVDPQGHADGNIVDVQSINTTAPTQFPPVYTCSTPMATHAQGSYKPGYPVGWDPTTGFGMPPEYMMHLRQGSQVHWLRNR